MILYPEPDLVFPSIRKLSKELQVFPLAFDESVFGKALYGFGKIDITLFELKRLKVTAFLYEKAGEEGCVIAFLRLVIFKKRSCAACPHGFLEQGKKLISRAYSPKLRPYIKVQKVAFPAFL